MFKALRDRNERRKREQAARIEAEMAEWEEPMLEMKTIGEVATKYHAEYTGLQRLIAKARQVQVELDQAKEEIENAVNWTTPAKGHIDHRPSPVKTLPDVKRTNKLIFQLRNKQQQVEKLKRTLIRKDFPLEDVHVDGTTGEITNGT